MATLVQFSRNIRRRGSSIQNNSARLVRRVGRAVLRELVNSTPVDKGVARSNWRVSVGNRTSVVIPAYAPGKKLGIGERSNARAAISAGNAQIALITTGPSGRGAGQALFISNNTEYIERLNNGYSSQAGAGFIEAATLRGRQEIRNFRLLRR